jgi:3-deoxy-D-manno-octulosonate 8-phosphate phosphatase KdsC-like HAD superfamily phosphatase
VAGVVGENGAFYFAYDEATRKMIRVFTAGAAERLGVDLDADKAAYVFVGDSPNDAPMFGFFPNACGVANVRDFAGRIEAEPAFVASGRGGAGFVEIADMLLARRRPGAG